MKLQHKYTRVTLTTTVIVLLMGSVGYYYLLKRILLHPVDRALIVEEKEILHHAERHGKLPEESYYHDQQIHFTETNQPTQRRFKTDNVYSPEEQEKEISRQLIFPVTVNGKTYTATVTKSQLEAEDLLLFILLVTGGVILLLFLLIFLVNRFLLKKAWAPFYSALNSMKRFDLSNREEATWEASSVDEFNALNAELQRMMDNARKDYNLIRTFADNASHEMQTPLAVINSKLDLLIQDTNLKERNAETIEAIYQSINKLTVINQSLLLLAKIENNQFQDNHVIHIDVLVDKKLTELEDLIESKKVTVECCVQSMTLSANPILVDTLLNNLLTNAIRHNVPYGKVFIHTFFKGIEIQNTSSAPALDTQTVFSRFQKDIASEGLGLGLAIIKQICDLYGYTIEYHFEDNLHAFKVKFA